MSNRSSVIKMPTVEEYAKKRFTHRFGNELATAKYHLKRKKKEEL